MPPASPTPASAPGSPQPAPRLAASASASDRAYAALRARVVSGEVPGGTMLSEGEVADELGMSRTPVREAFLRLQAEGWMQLFPKRGALVRPIEPDELAEVVEARHLVESAAVRTVTADDGATTALVKSLRGLVAAQRVAAESADLDTFALLDVTFHQTIADAGGNSILTTFYSSLRDRQHRITARTVRAGQDRVEAILAQHTELVDLVGAGDAAGFEAALAAHLGEIHRGIFGR
jgi:DNA-binding GntR family transcriptional regulator